MTSLRTLAAALLILFAPAGLHAQPRVRVASKPFTESYVLSEMVAQLIEEAGEAEVDRRYGLGGPPLVFEALKKGEVDVDVTYTGSIAHLFFKQGAEVSEDQLRSKLRELGLAMSGSLGFNNTYAIAVRAETARKLGLEKVSDLRGHSELRGAFTPDFLNYEDGFYKLQEVYGVRLGSVRPMQHSLAYQALVSREIDVTDAYTTDGTLPRFDLKLLRDDLAFFPKYYGVIVAREEVTTRFPRTWAALRKLEGKLDERRMIALNGSVDERKATVEEAARGFLKESGLLAPATAAKAAPVLDEGLWVATREHLLLVLSALLLSAVAGIPLGIVAFRKPRLGHVLVAAAGLLQTIPSLALLCFLIPFLGIGALPTVCALFFYGLLPIVQSTASGLFSLDPRLVETARILGLSASQRLRLVELPLASISILGGLKTSAVINVATATIAALIGAGGYGRYITSGLAMNDVPLILRGAVPTALMAVAFHAAFELLGRLVVPRGLRS